jgi:hypothetical protein
LFFNNKLSQKRNVIIDEGDSRQKAKSKSVHDIHSGRYIVGRKNAAAIKVTRALLHYLFALSLLHE